MRRFSYGPHLLELGAVRTEFRIEKVRVQRSRHCCEDPAAARTGVSVARSDKSRRQATDRFVFVGEGYY